MSTTAIFGAGVMGETLLSGLLRAGRSADDLVITERHEPRAKELTEKYGVRCLGNAEAAALADTLVLVVKPQDMGALLDEISDLVTPGDVVVSLAAGITTAFLESKLPDGISVVRVMPNTPALVDEGMAAISPGSSCTEAPFVHRQGGAGRRKAPGRRHGDLRQRSGIHLLRRRSHDRSRRPARPATQHRHRVGRADALRRGHHAQGDGGAPHRAAGAGFLARWHHDGRRATT